MKYGIIYDLFIYFLLSLFMAPITWNCVDNNNSSLEGTPCKNNESEHVNYSRVTE